MRPKYQIGIKYMKSCATQKQWECKVGVPVYFGRYQHFPGSCCLHHKNLILHI